MKTIEPAELERALEELRPEPDPAFIADMEQRMRLGFPQAKRRRPPRPAPKLALAGAASALLALVLTVSLIQQEDTAPKQTGEFLVAESPPTAAESTPPVPEPRLRAPAGDRASEPLEAASSGTVAVPSPPLPDDDGIAARERRRRVEQSAQLTLAAAQDDFDTVADSIFAIADRRRGFVARSSFTQADDGGGGSFELRVPAEQLQPALQELSRLATVRQRSEAGTDVTAAYVSTRDRLQAAKAERKGLLRRLERAQSDRAARAIRQRLRLVSGEIDGLRAQLARARERTSFATISVELVDRDTGGSGPGATRAALDDAVETLLGMLNFLIRALGVLLPLLILAAAGWFGARRLQRRARERALA